MPNEWDFVFPNAGDPSNRTQRSERFFVGRSLLAGESAVPGREPPQTSSLAWAASDWRVRAPLHGTKPWMATCAALPWRSLARCVWRAGQVATSRGRIMDGQAAWLFGLALVSLIWTTMESTMSNEKTSAPPASPPPPGDTSPTRDIPETSLKCLMIAPPRLSCLGQRKAAATPEMGGLTRHQRDCAFRPPVRGRPTSNQPNGRSLAGGNIRRRRTDSPSVRRPVTTATVIGSSNPYGRKNRGQRCNHHARHGNCRMPFASDQKISFGFWAAATAEEVMEAV
ncbi:hypothetical protein CSOJ01_01561 [Colletotrichum sojae]|uniref:Uncharacterized protein n=1 Tax=Colletotrichum sojae TaxID=2175907 RepID=A0A8H6JT75_9PEZI|nr:hypothetical protein CSOJ01_01561 [Colletotrichum sojae]